MAGDSNRPLSDLTLADANSFLEAVRLTKGIEFETQGTLPGQVPLP